MILDETRDGVRFQMKLFGPFDHASTELLCEYRVELSKSVSDAESAVWRLSEGHRIIWKCSVALAYEKPVKESIVIADAEAKLRKKRDLVEILLEV